MADSRRHDHEPISIGAGLLQDPNQILALEAGELALVRGQGRGQVRVERGDSELVLHDVDADVTWCYHRDACTLFIGSHTGALVYALHVGDMRILHEIALPRADDPSLLKFAFVSTPDRSRLVLVSEVKVIGFTWDGAIFLNRDLQATDAFVDVSNTHVGFHGIEHDERIYFVFADTTTAPFASAVAGIQSSSTGVRTIRRPDSVLRLPRSAFRETDVLEFGWIGQQQPNAVGIALDEVAALFIRTPFGMFPTYPFRAALVTTLTVWMLEIVRLFQDSTGTPHATLYVGDGHLYHVHIAVQHQKCYLRFTRWYLPADLDLVPPIVIAQEQFKAAFLHVCEMVHELVETVEVQSAQTRHFVSAFAQLRQVFSTS